MTRRWLAFDLETAKIIAEDADLHAERPLGISCWAVAWQGADGIQTKAGHGVHADGRTPSLQMSRQECRVLIANLQTAVDRGFTLLTHNGAGFDIDIVVEESGEHASCVALARGSVDTMLHFHCLKGFPVGLDAIAKGMGLAGKTEGMSGSLAPQLWAEGKHTEVLAYVTQDAISTLEVALAVEERHAVRWIAKSGKANNLPIDHWLTVDEALALPEPDVSWMKEPWPRSKFVGWMDHDSSAA